MKLSKHFPHAVHAWLTYQLLCGRSALFQESYLSQPVVEYLQQLYGRRVIPEHPIASYVTGKPGEQRKLDFAVVKPFRDHVGTAIEIKWIDDHAIKKQEILNDIMRLECFRNVDGSVSADRYFLVAGRTSNFTQGFQNATYYDGKKKDLYKKILSFGNESKGESLDLDVVIENEGETFRGFFADFEKNY